MLEWQVLATEVTQVVGPVVAWVLAQSTEIKLTLLGMAAGSGFGVVKGAIFLRKRFRRPFRVEPIRRKDEERIEAFVQLYEKVIDARSRLDSEEIAQWIRGQAQVEELLHTTLACSSEHGMVGFAQIMYCKKSSYGFVSYFGIDESNSSVTLKAAHALASALSRHLRRKCRGVRYVLFEVDDPSEPDLRQSERSLRKARLRKFKSLARTCNLSIGEVDAEYDQPEMPSDRSESNECRMRLLLIGTRKHPVPRSFSRAELLGLVRFVYYRVYLPSYYRRDKELLRVYVNYLHDLLMALERRTPPSVSILQ